MGAPALLDEQRRLRAAALARDGQPADLAGHLPHHLGREPEHRLAREVAGHARGVGGHPGAAPVADAEAEAYIQRQRKRDPDLWVIEIEDKRGLFAPDEPVI